MIILTANDKRGVDLSLYLVTGRDLLPPGMVPTLLLAFLFTHSIYRAI
jgi:hypothetical protein